MDVLRTKTKQYLTQDELDLVEQAYQFASQCTPRFKRPTGEPYLEHPIAIASILADLLPDVNTLAAAILHDLPTDCDVPLTEIAAKFGPAIARMVDGVAELGKVSRSAYEKTKERPVHPQYIEANVKCILKMLTTFADGHPQIVLIKMADQLHHMRTMDAMPPRIRRVIAQETMNIYAPLAHRLGVCDLKWQLEDLAFKHLDEAHYRDVARQLALRREKRQLIAKEAADTLRNELKKAKLSADVFGWTRNIYNIYLKLKRYENRGKGFDDIHDLYIVLVLVNGIHDCYNVLGVVHNLWQPIVGDFDDYIANPKESGYQSLHTTVMYQRNTPVTIRIATFDMHRTNELQRGVRGAGRSILRYLYSYCETRIQDTVRHV